jgi:hypothetical protein
MDIPMKRAEDVIERTHLRAAEGHHVVIVGESQLGGSCGHGQRRHSTTLGRPFSQLHS